MNRTRPAVCLLAPGEASADILGFNFFQDGFSEEAFVEGMFFGEDLDGNGQISSPEGEVTDFMASFSGNSSAGAFPSS